VNGGTHDDCSCKQEIHSPFSAASIIHSVPSDRIGRPDYSDIGKAVLGHVPHPVLSAMVRSHGIHCNAIGTFATAGRCMFVQGFSIPILPQSRTLNPRAGFCSVSGEFSMCSHVNFGLPGNVQNSVGFGQIAERGIGCLRRSNVLWNSSAQDHAIRTQSVVLSQGCGANCRSEQNDRKSRKLTELVHFAEASETGRNRCAGLRLRHSPFPEPRTTCFCSRERACCEV